MFAVSKKASFVSCIVAGSTVYAELMPDGFGQAYKGKASLTYDIPNSISKEYPQGKLLIIATDNISTHNVTHDGAIPYKGYVLNTLGVYCFSMLNENNISNPLISYGKEIFKHLHFPREVLPSDLHLRAIVSKKLDTTSMDFPFSESLEIIHKLKLTSKAWSFLQKHFLSNDLSLVSGEIDQVKQLVEAEWKIYGRDNLPIKIPGDLAVDISNKYYLDSFFLITGLSLQDYWRQNHFWSKS